MGLFTGKTDEEVSAIIKAQIAQEDQRRLRDYDAIVRALETSAVPDDPELARQQLIKLREDLSENLHLIENIEFD
jgi:hypothetical protein